MHLTGQLPTLLIVEDDDSVRNLVAIFLSQKGFRVLVEANGRDALEISRKEAIDLVLMGLGMPDLDGRATLIKLREVYPKIPCCFMSGNPGPHNPAELEKLGGAYLPKPFNMTVLVTTLWNLINSKFHTDTQAV